MLDLTFVSILIQELEKYIPKLMKLIFYEGWNKRLGTKDLNMKEIWEELYKREISLDELTSIVE